MRAVALRAQIWDQLMFVCVGNHFVAMQVWSSQEYRKQQCTRGVNRSQRTHKRPKPWMSYDLLTVWRPFEPPRCWVRALNPTKPAKQTVSSLGSQSANSSNRHCRCNLTPGVCDQLIHSRDTKIIKGTRCLSCHLLAGFRLCEIWSHTGAQSEEEALLYRGCQFQKVVSHVQADLLSFSSSLKIIIL